ncbi:MAG: carboxypeptidase regulatory-like domain-containing protein [Terriglobales bacterium]
MPKRFLLSLTVACFLLPLAAAHAQTTATIRGRVADPQDAIMVGVKVVARNVNTGIERETKTTSDGLYVIPFLQTGTYDVRVEAPNFAKAETKGVNLDVGDTRDANFKLKVGAATQVVEVTGEAPLVESTKTEGSTVINDTDVARLPTESNTAPFNAGTNMNDYATLAIGAPGVRYDFTSDSADLVGPGQINNRSNRYNVDGVPMNDITTVGRDALGASVDEVKEFQVITNNYNAENGAAGGLILNVITKSGTNTIHGDFHFFARGTNMEAVPFYTKLSGDDSPPPYFKHETGFTLGGPFIKDKTFWFVSYEKLLAGIPEALPFPPESSTTVTEGDDEVLWSAKIDHQINSKNLFTVRFNAQRATQSNLPVQTPAASAPSSLTGEVSHDHTLNFSETSTLTPHVVNEARVSWHRFLSQTPDNSSQPGQRTANTYEFADFCCPQGAGQNWYRGSDNLTWTHGAHTLKAGVSMDYVPWSSLFPQYHFGEWDSVQCGYPQTAPGTPCGPTTFTIGIGPAEILSKDNVYGWFVQDSWKLRPNLTMNYGLRWDYEAGAFKGGSIPFAGGFGSGCYQANGIIPACGSDKTNFQPRLGFAWGPRFDSGLLGKVFGGRDKSVISLGFAEITQLAYNNIVLDSLNFNGTPGTLETIVITNGEANSSPVFAAWPNAPSAAALAPFISPPGPPTPPFGRIRPISPNIQNPQTRNVQLSWQRELSNSMVMNIGYIGSFGFHQFGETDMNYPTILPDPAHPGYFYTTGRPNPNFGAIRENFSNRNSAYNGLLVSVEKRYAHHLQVNGNYTWSHLISSTEGFYGVSEPSNPFNVRASTRGPSEEDARHLANFRFTVDSDNRFHFNHFLSSVVNNWAFSLIGTAQSGRPYPISTGDSILTDEYFASFGAESMQTPNVLAGGVLSTAGIGGAGGSNMLISSSALTICPTCVPNTFVAPAGAATNGPIDMFCGVPVDFKAVSGTLGRNQGLGDPYIRGDISIRRAFRIPVHEGIMVQLRADLFNFANHTNFQLFNFSDVLSLLKPCGTTSGGVFTPAAGCPGQAGLDVTTGKYYGNNGQVLTLSALQHGRVSTIAPSGPNMTSLANPLFNGLGDPGTADINRQAQLSVKVIW